MKTWTVIVGKTNSSEKKVLDGFATRKEAISEAYEQLSYKYPDAVAGSMDEYIAELEKYGFASYDTVTVSVDETLDKLECGRYA